MAGSSQPPAGLVVVGANHRSSSVELRDRIFVDDAAAPGFLAGLAQAGLSQCLVMSTCDRVEVQAIHAPAETVASAVTGAFAAAAGLAAPDVEREFYTHTGTEAVRHLFAVAASLDSMVIGEPQVFGQLKAAHKLARAAGTMGAELEQALQAAYAAAKRVRGETDIAEGPVTMAASAARVARDIHGDLDRCAGLLIGASEMGEMVLQKLRDGGLGRATVAAANHERAAAVGRRLGCHSIGFDELAAALVQHDIVVAAVGSGGYLVSAELASAALEQRRRKPIFMIDAAVPGDIEPAVERLDGVFCYDLDDLEAVAQRGRATRGAAARVAWQILEEELDGFLRGRAERAAVPTLMGLRSRFESAREEALKRAPADAGEATRVLINRLLHEPSEALRDDATTRDAALDAAARRLFRLDEDE